MRSISVILCVALFPALALSLKCRVCEFKLLPPHNSDCNETCEGDVCFIVVNKFFNGTINAGCMHLREDDVFEDKAICQRGPHDNRCACSTGDNCNDPTAKINTYIFTENPVLEDYQWLPQIQPSMPSLQPIIPPVDIPIGNDMNDTAIELENGVTRDLSNELDDQSNVTQVMRNEENEDTLTVKTTVGLNVRDHSVRMNNNESQNNVETSTPSRSFTTGQGSVEVTKVTQDASPKMDIPKGNLTTDGSSGPNSSPNRSVFILLATLSSLIFSHLI